MNIGGSDESELVRVGAHPGLDFQSAPQRRPGVFGGVGRRDVHTRQPRPFVGAEVRELVVGRQQRMGFGVALGLGDLHDRLPADAGSGVLAADGTPVRIHVLEHAARTDVGVVRNRQEGRADALARLLEPLPEVFRPLAVERGEGQELPGDIGAFAHEHHPVNGVGGREAAPLPADQARENARFIVPVCDFDAALPGGADDGFEVDFLEGLVAVHGAGHLHEHQPFLAWTAAHLQQPPARRRICHALIAAEQRGGDAQVFGVIGDDEKVQRPLELDSPAETGVDRRHSLGETVGHVRIRGSILHGVGVVRIGTVDVRIAEVHLCVRSGLAPRGKRQCTDQYPGCVNQGMQYSIHPCKPIHYG